MNSVKYMRGLQLDRVHVATPDMDSSIEQFSELLGFEFGDVSEQHTTPSAGKQSLDFAYGYPGIELITPKEDNEVQKFLDENGPGVYAVAFRVADLDEAVDELREKGVEPVVEARHLEYAPEAVYHPNDFTGVMLILTEYPHPVEF